MRYGKWMKRFFRSALGVHPTKKKYALALVLMATLVFTPFSSSVADWDCVDDDQQYMVVINHEEQYSIWPADGKVSPGWNKEGMEGSKKECLDHIEEVWTDMRPLSLRKKMEEDALAAKEETKPIAPEKVENLDIDAVKQWVSYLTWMVLVGETYLAEDPKTGKCILSEIQSKELGPTVAGQNHNISQKRQEKDPAVSEHLLYREKVKALNTKVNYDLNR